MPPLADRSTASPRRPNPESIAKPYTPYLIELVGSAAVHQIVFRLQTLGPPISGVRVIIRE